MEEREGAQFGLLIASAVAYVASAVSIVWVSGTAIPIGILLSEGHVRQTVISHCG